MEAKQDVKGFSHEEIETNIHDSQTQLGPCSRINTYLKEEKAHEMENGQNYLNPYLQVIKEEPQDIQIESSPNFIDPINLESLKHEPPEESEPFHFLENSNNGTSTTDFYNDNIDTELQNLKAESEPYFKTQLPFYIGPLDLYENENHEQTVNDNVKKLRMKEKQRKHKCQVCLKGFSSSNSRSKHLTSHFTKNVITCRLCGAFFVKNFHFLIHFEVHFVKFNKRNNQKNALLLKDSNEDSGILFDNKSFKCTMCPKQFTRKFTRDVHMRIHTGQKLFKCETCKAQFIHESSLNRHLSSHLNKKSFECDICCRQFYRKFNLYSHKKTHSGEKPFMCEICSKKFSNKSNYVKHSKIHMGIKPFECSICLKRFINNSQLSEHFKVHTGEKLYKCQFCLKEFIYNSQLITHSRIHTGEKPFKCQICSKQFIDNSALIKHAVVHTTARPFRCDVCFKTFRLQHHVNKHKVIHSGIKPHKCEVCLKDFFKKSALNSHIRVHSGEKPFTCEICSRSFAESSSLKKHSKIHSVETPYSCETCFREFKHKSSYRRHLKIHLPGDNSTNTSMFLMDKIDQSFPIFSGPTSSLEEKNIPASV